MVKNAQDAEDLAQEVFIEVFKKKESFIGDSEIGTWIYRIAVNKCLEYLRRKKSQKRGGGNISNEIGENRIEEFNHPGVVLENKERAVVLFKAIETLSENQKVAFTLQKLEGLSIEEIGKIMRKNTSSVESMLFRARESLKQKLRSYYEQNEFV